MGKIAAVADSLNAGLVGGKFVILMDSQRFGRTYRDAPEIDGTVEVTAAGGKKPRPGDFVRVRLTSARGYARTGVLL